MLSPTLAPDMALSLSDQRPPTIGKGLNAAAADQAAKDFEAFFLGYMVESMFAGIKTDGPFGGGPGEKAFRSLLNQEYGKAIAQAGGLGIADAVKLEILKAQEGN
jgi:Rod binding domain-containing protein